MNPLLLIGGTGVLAYLLLRHRAAVAATQAMPTPPAAGQVPIVIQGISAEQPWNPQPPTQLPAAPRQPATAQSPPLIPPPALITTPARPFPGEVAKPTLQLMGRWVWPVPRWQGRAPVISDGFGSPRPGMLHQGVDVMFARISTDPFPVGGVNGSRGYVMPNAWPAVAASDGVLWSAQRSPRGYAVVIDHGSVATFYQHLETLLVPETSPQRGMSRAQRIPIRAGQPLGVIGGDPLNAPHLKHLHFELWPAGPQSAIDPARTMASWQILTPRDLEPFLAVRNATNLSKQAKEEGLIYVGEHLRRPPGTAG